MKFSYQFKFLIIIFAHISFTIEACTDDPFCDLLNYSFTAPLAGNENNELIKYLVTQKYPDNFVYRKFFQTILIARLDNSSCSGLAVSKYEELCRDLKSYLHHKKCFYSSKNTLCSLLNDFQRTKSCNSIIEPEKSIFAEDKGVSISRAQFCHSLSNADIARKAINEIMSNHHSQSLNESFVTSIKSIGDDVTGLTTVFFNNGILNITQNVYDKNGSVYKRIFPLFDLTKKRYYFSENPNRDQFDLPSLNIQDSKSKEITKISFPIEEDLHYVKDLIEKINFTNYRNFSRIQNGLCSNEESKSHVTIPHLKWDNDGNCIMFEERNGSTVKTIISKKECLKQKILITLEEWGAGAPQVSVLTLEELQKLQDTIIKDNVIPYQYKFDFCYTRAFQVGRFLEARNITSGNLFLITQDQKKPLRTEEKDSFQWGYHVAPFVVLYDEKEDKLKTFIIDPTISSAKPLSQTEWINKISFGHNSDQSHLNKYFRERHVHLITDLMSSPLERPNNGQLELAQMNLDYMNSELCKLK